MAKNQEFGRHLAEIGTRFLQRTLLEVDELRDLFAGARAGADEHYVAMAQLAHRIHGAGGMFGFDAVSECALTLQKLVVQPTRDAAFMSAVQGALQALEAEVRAAVAAPRASE